MMALGWALPFDFAEPRWMWLCLLIPVLIAASLRSLAGLPPLRRGMALAARSLLIVLLACCLGGVEHVRRNNDLTVIYLMDRSYSAQGLQDAQESFIRESTRSMPADDRVGLIDFARHAYLQQLPLRGGYFLPPGRLPPMANVDRTDIGAALRLAMAMFPHDTAKRIVLMSDGNDNMGDVLSEARRAQADGVPIDVVPLWYEHRNEVYVERLIAPTHAEPGEQVPLRIVLHTQRPVSGVLSIYRNGELVDLAQDDRHVHLRPGSNTFFLKLPLRNMTTQAFEAVFQPDDDSLDGIALNNRARAFTFVAGGSRALLVTANAGDDVALMEALQSENVIVDMVSIDQLGAFELADMLSYASIILSNTPAAAFTDDQHRSLAAYVKDTGSGLIMTGGDEGFGAGGWIGSPVEAVMPVSFEIKHKRVIPRGALVLVMHSCEIPRGNYWAKEMAKKSADTISSQDYFGVLAYGYSPGGENWEVPLDLNTNRAAVKAKIDRMQVGDMPDFGSTLQMAYRELTAGRGRDAAQKHVIILSDGDASPPTSKLLNDYSAAKITVSTIGIGWGAHVMEGTMRHISEKTGGKYYAARNPRQLPQIFTKESKVVRRPLIIEEPFVPRVAQAHSALLAGIDVDEALPPLGGMVLTSPKQSPNVLMPLVRPTEDGADPVLAHWQYELGKTVAFAGGYWPRWGEAWTRWPKFAKFWAQVVRWTMRQESPANFDTYTKVEGQQGRIVIDALDKNAAYLNNLVQRARVVGPDNEEIPLEFRQTGPGKYEASFDAEKAGQYLATVQIFDGGRNLGTLRTGLAVPFSPEYRDLRPNEGMLRQIAEVSGGRWLDLSPQQADVFRHDLPPSESRRPAWDWVLAWLVLPAFLLDVAVRRLASMLALSMVVEAVLLVVLLIGCDVRYSGWWGILGAFVLAETIGWTMRARYIRPLFEYLTHGVTALAQAGERSAVALDKLKTTREKVREGTRGGDGDDTSGRSADERAARRFDAETQGAPGRGESLEDALGAAGARESQSDRPSRRPPAGPPAATDEETTSRLLRAKRRAQRDRKEKEDR